MTKPTIHNLNMRRDPRTDENIAYLRKTHPELLNDSDVVRMALELAARNERKAK